MIDDHNPDGSLGPKLSDFGLFLVKDFDTVTPTSHISFRGRELLGF